MINADGIDIGTCGTLSELDTSIGLVISSVLLIIVVAVVVVVVVVLLEYVDT